MHYSNNIHYHYYICLISSQLNLSKLHINALVLTNNNYYYHKHRPSTIYLQLTNQHKQFYHTNHLMNWFNQQINNQYLSTNSIINNDHSISNNNNDQQLQQQQYIIEKYKKKILLQLHMNTVPNVNVNNQSEWNSLPIVLRNRIKNEIDTTNHLINNKLIEHDEEKETLILLKQCKFIDYSSVIVVVVTVVVHNDDVSKVRNTEEEEEEKKKKKRKKKTLNISRLQSHTKIKSRLEEFDKGDLSTDEENDYIPHMRYFVQLIVMFDMTNQSSMKLPASNIFTLKVAEVIDPIHINRVTLHVEIIKPQIANSLLSDDHYSSVLTFNLTQRMITWLNYYAINNIHQPLIRYLLITCNNCNNEQNIINPKKIRYRPSLQRTKRSLTKSDETISNVCRSNGHHYSCCTQPLSVKFSDIGWDNWIIHPKSFEPNYCRGSCKVTSTKSLHYDVMDLLLRKNLTQFSNIQRDEVQSCCHPTQLTSMSVLYLDSNRELQMHTLHNLIVLGCGCS
ncbi:Inhibin beta A chain [Schistosoma japonicum]|nr:Inhibin beta A chain [Schistosoma japonicum]